MATEKVKIKFDVDTREAISNNKKQGDAIKNVAGQAGKMQKAMRNAFSVAGGIVAAK